MLFDTHAHFEDKRFNEDRDTLLSSMPQNNVSLIMNVGDDMKSSYASAVLAEKYDFIYAAVGVHPHYAKNIKNGDLEKLASLLERPKVKALGEIGLDYHYDLSPRDIQKQKFIEQMELAVSLNKPVIIHDREAHQDCFDIIKKFKAKGVFHCYAGSLEMAKELIKIGYYLSFTGVITFKNAVKAHEIIKYIPEDRLMIETDCPYLAPEPFRGQRNHSGYVYRVAEVIAQIKGWSFEKTAEITNNNGKTFFDIKE